MKYFIVGVATLYDSDWHSRPYELPTEFNPIKAATAKDAKEKVLKHYKQYRNGYQATHYKSYFYYKFVFCEEVPDGLFETVRDDVKANGWNAFTKHFCWFYEALRTVHSWK